MSAHPRGDWPQHNGKNYQTKARKQNRKVERFRFEQAHLLEHHERKIDAEVRSSVVAFVKCQLLLPVDVLIHLGGDLAELQRVWKPSSMLPKMYLDRDINNTH